ncbi:zinc carboxypeptidase [Colletotrichum karsti]|uniref:Inactive metallocarboxypeptidase ECM14 n=1 Tax=Colletotrichum karsti TaxID=1095194 RepID=A0A9P6HV02_9PEZI|nr:zinc carboxypeptidase [Colletotrichum karsti]KAF9870849.1 zinc carboxypeptidase [Colletotrichum karsti]
MRPSAVLSLASVALLAPPADAARIDPYHNDRNAPASLFPLLTWLRDSAIELVFGPAPGAKSAASHSAHKGNKATLRTKYNDQVVLRFNLTTPDQETAFAESAARLFLDVWAFNREYVDVRLRNDDIPSLLGLLPSSLRSAYSTLIPDLAASVFDTYPAAPVHVQRLEDRRSVQLSHHGGDNVFFQEYQPLSVIVPWMRLTEAMFSPITELISIGKSFEGRDIPALRVGVKTHRKSAEKRKTVVVTGGMHAREWISTTTTNYVAWSFITSFGKEPMITKLLEHFDFVFIPVVNPDGVEYTWQVDRLWRKSRQQTGMQWCRGFDLDHAFGFAWSGLDSENDPCSESYGGNEPWEATEAIALAKWAKNESRENSEFVGLIDLHSYSQQILFPFAYSCDVDPPNVENLEELATGLAKAIRLSNGEQYSVTSACEGAVASRGDKTTTRRIETGGGSAIDWFYHELHAHYSYQIKLRDTGSYGFLLPKDNIIPVGEEIFNAMKYFGDYLLGNNGIEKSTGVPAQSEDDLDRGVELKRMRRRR